METHDKDVGRCDAVSRGAAECRGGDKDFDETTTGLDWSVALPEDATFADAEALLVEALGVEGAVFFTGFLGGPRQRSWWKPSRRRCAWRTRLRPSAFC